MTTIVIPLYDGVTHLDFTGPHQFLSRVPEAEVIAASLEGAVTASDGLTFSNLQAIEKIERCDVLCVPGGVGCVPAMEDHHFLEAVRRLARTATFQTSVCTGSLILGAVGVLRGHRAACHWAWRDMLKAFGAIPEEGRVVRDGNVITGGGVTAGIDFALILISELWGIEMAQSIQLMLEYAPVPPFDAGLPDVAPNQIRQAVLDRIMNTLEDARRRVDLIARQQAGESTTLVTGSR